MDDNYLKFAPVVNASRPGHYHDADEAQVCLHHCDHAEEDCIYHLDIDCALKRYKKEKANEGN